MEDGVEQSSGANDLLDHESGTAFFGLEGVYRFVAAAGFHFHLFQSMKVEASGFGIALEVDVAVIVGARVGELEGCLLYTSPSPRDQRGSRMPASA